MITETQQHEPGTRTRRQREILDALEEIFLEEGFRRNTVGDLATRLRCSRSTLYAIEPTKEELFLAVEDRLLRRAGRRAQELASARSNPIERVEAYLEGALSGLEQAGTRFLDDVFAYPPARYVYEEHQRQAIARLKGFVQEGIASGEINHVDPTLAAAVLDAAFRRVRRPEFLRDTGMTLGEAFRQVSQLLRHGLGR